MTQHKFKYLLLLVIGLGISFTACKDYLDVNVDPNQSTTSRIDLQLSAAQLQTAIGLDQRIYGTVNIWSQYWTGGPGVSLGEADQHKLSTSEGNEIFLRLMRSSGNLNYIIKNSTNSNYLGIAKLMKAYNFQVLVDLFGDIPYSEALKGDISDGSILHPKYDDDQAIYQSLEAEVQDAIRLINAAGPEEAHPGADDLLYGGVMTKWLKFANTLLLKIYLRQGEAGRAEAVAQLGAAAETDFIIANADNALVHFPGGSSGSNPAYNAAFSTALGVYYAATTTVIDYLNATNDPRLTYFFEPDAGGQYTGLYPGDVEAQPLSKTFAQPNGANSGDGIIYGRMVPVILISAWEGNLLLAEAKARGWFGEDVEASYNEAVFASFEYLGVTESLDDYLAGPGGLDSTSTESIIRSIALQKWTSMNGLQPVESWIEVRRFDTPTQHIFYPPGGIFKTPVKNSLGGDIYPTILPYPELEQSLNQNFPGPHPITAKVFWDQ